MWYKIEGLSCGSWIASEIIKREYNYGLLWIISAQFGQEYRSGGMGIQYKDTDI